MERAFGRYQANQKLIAGVYSKSYGDKNLIQEIRKLSDEFATREGRRPRILIAKLGQDNHDRGARIIATGFSDLGFDVDIGPLFQTPSEAVKQAIENDVHIIGVSSLAAGHKTLIPELIRELAQRDASDILVIAGGVIPEKDHEELLDQGVAAVFGPGTSVAVAAKKVLALLLS